MTEKKTNYKQINNRKKTNNNNESNKQTSGKEEVKIEKKNRNTAIIEQTKQGKINWKEKCERLNIYFQVNGECCMD